MSNQFRARRINVVGTSSVGKTTVAAAFASLLGVPHVELDALHWSTHLFSRDSLLWWILTTYRRRRREYPPLLAARPDLVAIHLRSARAPDRWLADVSRGVG